MSVRARRISPTQVIKAKVRPVIEAMLSCIAILLLAGKPTLSHLPLTAATYMSRTLHVPRHGTGELVAMALADAAVELASNWSAHWLRTANQAATLDRQVHRKAWHSEEGQDKVVAQLLGHKHGGFHIDLAANGAVLGSNTRAFERDYGWSGVCIEANPQYWAALVGGVRSCHLVGAAIVGHREVGSSVSFLPHKAQSRVVLPGEESSLRDKLDDAAVSSLITVRATSLRRVLRAAALNVPRTIDYFSLDIEGAELLALSTFPWKEHRFAVMTVERPRQPLRDLLESQGYSYVCHLGYQPDEVWVHLELASQRWSPKGGASRQDALQQCVARLFAAADNGTAMRSHEDCQCRNDGTASKRLS